MLDPPSTSRHAAGGPAYTADHSPAYTLESVSGQGSGLAEGPVRPSWEQDIAPSPGGAMKPQLHRKHCAVFVVGNLVYVAVVVVEILQLLDMGLDDCDRGSDDDRQENVEEAEPSTTESPNTNSAIFALISGLVFQVYFSTVLSLIYRSPLDVKSVHKIPQEALVTRAESFNVYGLAPFSWAWICLFSGTASTSLSENAFCGCEGGSRLGIYLLVSGVVMQCVGFLFYYLSFVGLVSCPASLSSNSTYFLVRTTISQRILSKGIFLDVVCRLQSALWLFRVGRFGSEVTGLLGVCSLFGVVLTVIGSLAPDLRDRSPTHGHSTTAVNDVELRSRELDM